MPGPDYVYRSNCVSAQGRSSCSTFRGRRANALSCSTGSNEVYTMAKIFWLIMTAVQGELMNCRIPIAPHMCPIWRATEGGHAMTAGQWHIHCTEPTAVIGVTKTGLQRSPSGSRPGPDVHIRFRTYQKFAILALALMLSSGSV